MTERSGGESQGLRSLLAQRHAGRICGQDHLKHSQLLLNLLLLASGVGKLLNIVAVLEDMAVQQVLQLEHVLSKVAAAQKGRVRNQQR